MLDLDCGHIDSGRMDRPARQWMIESGKEPGSFRAQQHSHSPIVIRFSQSRLLSDQQPSVWSASDSSVSVIPHPHSVRLCQVRVVPCRAHRPTFSPAMCSISCTLPAQTFGSGIANNELTAKLRREERGERARGGRRRRLRAGSRGGLRGKAPLSCAARFWLWFRPDPFSVNGFSCSPNSATSTQRPDDDKTTHVELAATETRSPKL